MSQSRSARRKMNRRVRRSAKRGGRKSIRRSMRRKSMRGGELLTMTDFNADFSYKQTKGLIYTLSYTKNSETLKFDFRNPYSFVQFAASSQIKSESANLFIGMANIPPPNPGSPSLYNFINSANLTSLVVTIQPNAENGVTVKAATTYDNMTVDGRNSFDQVKAWLVDPTNAVNVKKTSIMGRMFSSPTPIAAASV